MAGAPTRERVLWDVVEEHLEEGAYAALVYDRALQSPVQTLADLERHPEELLIAHVDGLRAGGAAVRERLLLPALAAATEEEPEYLLVAAWTLFEDEAFDALAAALPPRSAPWLWHALADAARHTRNDAIDGWIRGLLAASSTRVDPCTLLWLAYARSLRVDDLLGPLQSFEAPVVAAAARLARHADPARLMAVMQYLLDHDDAQVRDAALVCSLSWGAQKAWLKCREWALDPAQPSELASVLYAALGTRADQRDFAVLLDADATRQSTLFALGFSGNRELAGPLLAALNAVDPLEAKLAAQSLGLIFGFSPAADEFSMAPAAPREAPELPPAEDDPEAQAGLPPLEDDDLDADLVPSPEDELPQPNATAIAEFCARAPGSSTQRTLAGRAWNSGQVAEVLDGAPLRVRHALALSHGVRSAGSAWLDTRAATVKQRAGLVRVAASASQRHVGF
ncbi:MAG TPA: hypothetical protein VFZ61_27915 [Polyangiales bacterium]